MAAVYILFDAVSDAAGNEIRRPCDALRGRFAVQQGAQKHGIEQISRAGIRFFKISARKKRAFAAEQAHVEQLFPVRRARDHRVFRSRAAERFRQGEHPFQKGAFALFGAHGKEILPAEDTGFREIGRDILRARRRRPIAGDKRGIETLIKFAFIAEHGVEKEDRPVFFGEIRRLFGNGGVGREPRVNAVGFFPEFVPFGDVCGKIRRAVPHKKAVVSRLVGEDGCGEGVRFVPHHV